MRSRLWAASWRNWVRVISTCCSLVWSPITVLGAPILQHRIDRLSAEIVSALHDQDIAVWAWPTDTEQSLVDSLALGVDAVIGDDAQFMLDALERLSPATPPSSEAD